MINLRSLLLALVLLGVCFASVTHAARPAAGARLADFNNPRGLWLEWSYQYNDATTRTYRTTDAKIVAVSEFIYEDPEVGDGYYIEWYGEADSVTRTGRAFDAVIIIVPMVNSSACWSLTLTSNYSLLAREWKAAGVCYRAYAPLVRK